MSEQESIELYARLRECIRKTQRRMVERKAKLGESIVIADENGMPLVISAQEALPLYSGGKDKQ